MKKVFVSIIIFVACFFIIGCKSNKENDENLKNAFNKIGEYFGNESLNRSNLGAYYLDEKKGKVVVVLVNNTKEQQDAIKEITKVDFKYIIFVQGGPYTTFSK